MTVIKAENLVKDYGLNGLTVHALRGVNLEFQSGEFAAVAGPSGSGKSTFLHLAGCLDTLTKGSLSIGGQDVAGLSKKRLALLRRHNIGFIFQAYNLIPVLTVLENIAFPLTLLGVDKREIRDRVAQALAEVGLEGMEKRRPKEMSGGQQQRVAIARALVCRPKIVIADEPTANLDSANGERILNLMKKVNQEDGATFIFSTHDPTIWEMANHIVFLQDGTVRSERRQ